MFLKGLTIDREVGPGKRHGSGLWPGAGVLVLAPPLCLHFLIAADSPAASAFSSPMPPPPRSQPAMGSVIWKLWARCTSPPLSCRHLVFCPRSTKIAHTPNKIKYFQHWKSRKTEMSHDSPNIKAATGCLPTKEVCLPIRKRFYSLLAQRKRKVWASAKFKCLLANNRSVVASDFVGG